MDSSMKRGRMATEVARILLKNWVWIPDEVLPHILDLRRMNTSRFQERGVFWKQVLEGAKCFATSKEKNLPVVSDLLTHLCWYQLPEVESGELVSGMAFNTMWYRKHQKLAFSFFQVLQNWRVERRRLSWEWRLVQVGTVSQMKVFVIKEVHDDQRGESANPRGSAQ